MTAKSISLDENSQAEHTGAAHDPSSSHALLAVAEYGQALLTAHVLGCKRCLAGALFCDQTLAHVGCREYKGLLARMLSMLGTPDSKGLSNHIDGDTLEEYCFSRLPEAESTAVERHIQVCPHCAQDLAHRMEFIACMKDALNFVPEERSAQKSRAAQPVFGRKLALTM